MIIKRTIRIGVVDIQYEANLEGTLTEDFNGTVVVHDPEFHGGRRRAFLLPATTEVPVGHVVICRAAFKY